jgi:hypothetical protein
MSMGMGMGMGMAYGSVDPSGYWEFLSSYFPQQVFPTIEESWLRLTSSLFCFFSTPPVQDLASQVSLSLICSANFANYSSFVVVVVA